MKESSLCVNEIPILRNKSRIEAIRIDKFDLHNLFFL